MLCVTGLPRCGSTSVAQALTILGYSVVHHCPLTNPRTINEAQRAFRGYSEHDAVVSSSFLSVYRFSVHDAARQWIILDRDEREIELSLHGLGETLYKDQLRYWRQAKKLSEDYYNSTVFNVNEGWEPLCKFLGKDIPEIPFPHQNKGPEMRGSGI